jgi:SAM-dependent methyltransferase
MITHSPAHSPALWIDQHLPSAAPGGTALDLACGTGRHTSLLLARGYKVTAIDREIARLGDLARKVEAIQADLEDGSPWPFAGPPPGRQFDVIVVTDYLHRPLFPSIAAALAPGGLLLYETFAVGNEKYGKPSNPNFLLRDGELLDVARHHSLRVLAYAAVDEASPHPAVKQRIAAQKPKSS